MWSCIRIRGATVQTSGIPWGYRLVSTYDLPHSKPGGGAYSGVNFGDLKFEVFHLGGGVGCQN